MQHSTVCITGGSGFVGRNLAKRLSEKFSVRILDIRPPPSPVGGAQYSFCDVTDYSSVRKCLAGCGVVIHTAVIQIPAINEAKRKAYRVNIVGTENVARAVDEIEEAKGMLLTGTWHVFGEHGLSGTIDEAYGYRPDKVEPRARVYALSKVVQEGIVRLYDEMSDKVFGVVRLGTVLGEGMPPKTAANIFIENGLKGKPITPYRHSMHRPMLYVDIDDVCLAFERYVEKILACGIDKRGGSVEHVVNLFYPEPITVLELAQTIRDLIVELSGGRIVPEVKVVDRGVPMTYDEGSARKFKVDLSKLRDFLGIKELTSPRASLRKIISSRMTMLLSKDS